MKRTYPKWLPWAIFVLAVIIDQCIKIYVKLHFTYGEAVQVFSWFYINFVENPGMAFGMTMGPKVVLTTFRIVASGCLIWYLAQLIKRNYGFGLVLVISLVLAGAIGNLIDCLFYGVIFSTSTAMNIAEIFPAGGGYTTFMNGKVVDMLYFPLFTFPRWVPYVGGEIFFGPIFNFADTCVTSSIFALLLFCRKSFSRSLDELLTFKKK